MSRILVHRLLKVEREFLAANSERTDLERRSGLFVETDDLARSTLQDVREALSGLETTYTIRLFAEFEGVLRDCWSDGGGDPEEHSVN